MYRENLLLDALVAQVESDLPHQVLDSSREDFGAVIWPEHGFSSIDHTTGGLSLARMAAAYLLDGSRLQGDPDLRVRVLAAVRFFEAWQRPTGLIDLPTVDFNSPPDTAFLVQLLCPILAIARERASRDENGAGRIADAIGRPLLKSARGIVGRGFRTPNHRWVICSALAQAMRLFPELDAGAYVESILAETIDINADGEFSERSTGIYNAVCNRSLLFIARHFGRPELIDHVRANLAFMAAMINPDGTVDTTISRRQDSGVETVPISMADSFFMVSVLDSDQALTQIADQLAQHAMAVKPRGADASIYWMLHAILATAKQAAKPVRPLPSKLVAPARQTFFAESKVWRFASEFVSATSATGSVAPFSMRCGDIAIRAMRFRGTYFHAARFKPTQIDPVSGGGVRLTHHADAREAPAWDLPLGRPVVFDNPHVGYYPLADGGVRKRWMLPPLDMALTIIPASEEGFNLHITTHGGMARVPFILEFFVAAGGTLCTDAITCRPHAGDLIELNQGVAIYHTMTHAVQIASAQPVRSMVGPIESTPVAGCFRLVIPMISPVDEVISLRCGLWSEATRSILFPRKRDAEMQVAGLDIAPRAALAHATAQR